MMRMTQSLHSTADGVIVALRALIAVSSPE